MEPLGASCHDHRSAGCTRPDLPLHGHPSPTHNPDQKDPWAEGPALHHDLDL